MELELFTGLDGEFDLFFGLGRDGSNPFFEVDKELDPLLGLSTVGSEPLLGL